MSLLHSLSRGTITNTLFPGERRKHCTAHRLFLQVNRRVSLLHLYSWQHDVSSKIRYQVAPDQSDSPKSLVLSLTGCSNKGPFSSMSVSQTTQVSTPFSHAEPRYTQTDDHSGGWALSSGCCPRLCLWQLDSRLTGEHGSATVLRDFVKYVAHQNARAAPAEVSHPLLTMALLAPPVTCELGNERRGGAVIYITNVRVRRTWTPLVSPRLISLSDQMGMHNTSDGQ